MRDPIGRLEEALIKLNFIDLKTIKSEKKKILDYLNLSWEKSIKDPYPDDAQLLNYVYSQKIKWEINLIIRQQYQVHLNTY